MTFLEFAIIWVVVGVVCVLITFVGIKAEDSLKKSLGKSVDKPLSARESTFWSALGIVFVPASLAFALVVLWYIAGLYHQKIQQKA